MENKSRIIIVSVIIIILCILLHFVPDNHSNKCHDDKCNISID